VGLQTWKPNDNRSTIGSKFFKVYQNHDIMSTFYIYLLGHFLPYKNTFIDDYDGIYDYSGLKYGTYEIFETFWLVNLMEIKIYIFTKKIVKIRWYILKDFHLTYVSHCKYCPKFQSLCPLLLSFLIFVLLPCPLNLIPNLLC